MENQIVISNLNTDNFYPVIQIVLDGLTSEHSKRSYKKSLTDFFIWYIDAGKPGLSKSTIQKYKSHLQESNLSSSSINLHLSAIKKLASEASDNNLIDTVISNGISNIKGIPKRGVRTGQWLDKNQAQELINSVDTASLKGKRDKALLSVMLMGLRRSEVVNLKFEDLKFLNNRWVIIDIVGKAGHRRSIPIAGWVKSAIDSYTQEAGLYTGYIFLRILKGDNITEKQLTPQAIRFILKEYIDINPHDLRRTYAKLSYDGGSAIEQIQLSLGHMSSKTTELYLGIQQSLTDAPADHLQLTIK